MKAIYLILFVCAVVLLITPASATYEVVSAYRDVTYKGPLGILVSLQFENFIPVSTARIYYNWISVGLITMIAALASARTTRFVGVLLPIFAGLLVYMGWLTNANPSHPEQLWGVIVVTAILAAAIYMKGALHEKFGIAGPGSMLYNIVFYIILLQAVVGFVNSTDLWDYNTAPTASTEYSGFDLGTEVNTLSGTGGASADITELGNFFLTLAFGCLKLFLSIAASLLLFSAVIGVIYPWIPASSYGLGFLVIMQLGIYIVYLTSFIRYASGKAVEGDF